MSARQRHVLVTGGAGFIGINLTERCSSWYVSETSRLEAGTGWRPSIAVTDGVGSLHHRPCRGAAASPALAAARA